MSDFTKYIIKKGQIHTVGYAQILIPKKLVVKLKDYDVNVQASVTAFLEELLTELNKDEKEKERSEV